MMWRGTAEGRPFLSGSTLAITGSTSSVKFVAYPIAARGHETALINWVAEVMVGGSEPPSRPDWNSRGAAGRGAAALQGLDVRLAGRAGADVPLAGDPRVPDGGPGPAAVVGPGPGDADRRRRAPGVPDRVQRRLAGDHRRARAGPRAGRGRLPGRRPRRATRRSACPPSTRSSSRPGTCRSTGSRHGQRPRPRRLRPDRGRADPGRAGGAAGTPTGRRPCRTSPRSTPAPRSCRERAG